MVKNKKVSDFLQGAEKVAVYRKRLFLIMKTASFYMYSDR
jgi:hypothetical protein